VSQVLHFTRIPITDLSVTDTNSPTEQDAKRSANIIFPLIFKHLLRTSPQTRRFQLPRTRKLSFYSRICKAGNIAEWLQPVLGAKGIVSLFTLLSTRPGPVLETTHPLSSAHQGQTDSGEELGHSLPSNAKVKNEWSTTSTQYYVLKTGCLIAIRKIAIFLDLQLR
jgi:hypothetical protein